MWRKTYAGNDRTGPVDHDERVQAGIPDMDLLDLFMVPYGPDTGHLDFSPVGPFTGREVASTIALMDALYARHGHSYVVGILLLPRSAIHVSTAFYDTKDEAQTKAVYNAYSDMVVEMTRAGYPIYRTNIQHMDLVADQYDFGDHALRRFTETIKDAVDPNGILSPGKRCAAAIAMSRKTRCIRRPSRASDAPTVSQRSWLTMFQHEMINSRAMFASRMSSP